jgi:hypothetical protein
MNIPCEKTETIDDIKTHLDKMDDKLDKLLDFRSRVMGIISFITIVGTVTINIIISAFKK